MTSARPQGDALAYFSTYPPTLCGLATFSAALAEGLEGNGATVGVARVADGPAQPDRLARAQLDSSRRASGAEVTSFLNDFDAVIVQHEYGLYGGADGEEVLDVLRGLRAPRSS